jgi:hypothetical protein
MFNFSTTQSLPVFAMPLSIFTVIYNQPGKQKNACYLRGSRYTMLNVSAESGVQPVVGE